MNKEKQNEIFKIVKINYEEIAESFDETREKPIWPPLLELLRNVGRGERVLDVGCGNGRILKSLSGQGAEYVGIDQSQRLVGICQQKYPKNKFEYLDITNLGNLPEYNFDWVFCVAVLHHLPGFDQRLNAFKQLKNKINDNGTVVVTVWNMWSEDRFRKMIWKFFLLKLIGRNQMDFGDVLFDWKRGETTSKRYYHAFRRGELKKLVKMSGLKVKQLFRDRFNYYLVLTK